MTFDTSRAVSGTLSRRRTLLGRLARPAEGEPLDVFCSGIGGVGLSGLARILAGLGHRVRGSDQSRGPLADALEAEGIPVAFSQEAANLDGDADVFVCTAALPPTHPELVRAIERGVPVVKYAEALGALVAARRGVAISGTHGKTTTTALTAFVLARCGRDPSWIVGGAPRDLPANGHLGSGPELVLEACEYDRSFANYKPAVAVVLNVEEDHLDCYEDLRAIVEAFVQFGQNVREGGAIVVSADWRAALEVGERVRQVRPDVSLVTFAVEREAHVSARDVRFEDGLGTFELVVDGAPVTRVKLGIPGRHNVANALAAIAAARCAGVAPEQAARAAEEFVGVRRRFEVLGEPRGITVVDDYAHHPTAVQAVIDAARGRYPGRRVVALFEPHQASRTRQHLDGFAKALASADRVVVADIYVCRDTPEDVKAVSAGDLARATAAIKPGTFAHAPGGPDQVLATSLELLQPGDVALFMGAGRTSGVAHAAVRRLAAPPAAVSGARPRGLASTSGVTARPGTSGKTPRSVNGLVEGIELELGALVKLDVPLGPYCTFRTGGRARLFAEPATEAEAVRIVRAMQRRGVPVIPVGGGSNLLFAGARIDACVLATRRLRGAEALSETRLRVLAGDGLQGTLRLAERHGLAGLEAFAGIPGTVGGAVFGNAGGPPGGGAVGERVARVRLLEQDGTVAWHGPERLGLRYRHTDLDEALVLAIELELTPDDPDAIRTRRLAATKKKGATQPLDARSAGCFFKNPPGESAGRLIDQCGLKGLRRGGASVSTVHANFVQNDGDATPDDVLAVVAEVQRVVRAARGIELVPEVKLIR